MTTKAPVSYYKVVPVAQPAVGTEFTLTAPGGEYWRVVSLRFTLVTSAAVANRTPRLRVSDGTDVYASHGPVAVQAAGVTLAYSAHEGSAVRAAIGGEAGLSWPTRGHLLQPGHRIVSSTDLIDVGDQYSAIVALVQSFPAGPDLEWLPTVDTQVSEMG